MKKLILLAFSFILVSSAQLAAQIWEIVKDHKRAKIQGLQCYSCDTCILMTTPVLKGNGALVYITFDGAKNWELIYADSVFDEDKFIFPPFYFYLNSPNKNLIVLASDNGTIVRSTDLGKTWEKSRLPLESGSLGYDGFQMYDDKLGVAFPGLTSKIFYTLDGCITWNLLPQRDFFKDLWINFQHQIIPEPGVFQLIASDSLSKTYFVRTVDFGKNWDIISINEEGLGRIYFLDKWRGWGGGGVTILDSDSVKKHYERIFYTENGGESWTMQRNFSNDSYKAFTKFRFLNDKIGFAGGEAGLLVSTTDGGKNWLKENVIEKPTFADDLNSISYPCEEVVYITMDDKLYKKTMSGSSVLWGWNNNEPSASIFPNPASDILNINVREFSAETNAEIYNVLGSLVATYKITGDALRIDISALPAGVYVARIGNKRTLFVKE